MEIRCLGDEVLYERERFPIRWGAKGVDFYVFDRPRLKRLYVRRVHRGVFVKSEWLDRNTFHTVKGPPQCLRDHTMEMLSSFYAEVMQNEHCMPGEIKENHVKIQDSEWPDK